MPEGWVRHSIQLKQIVVQSYWEIRTTANHHWQWLQMQALLHVCMWWGGLQLRIDIQHATAPMSIKYKMHVSRALLKKNPAATFCRLSWPVTFIKNKMPCQADSKTSLQGNFPTNSTLRNTKTYTEQCGSVPDLSLRGVVYRIQWLCFIAQISEQNGYTFSLGI